MTIPPQRYFHVPATDETPDEQEHWADHADHQQANSYGIAALRPNENYTKVRNYRRSFFRLIRISQLVFYRAGSARFFEQTLYLVVVGFNPVAYDEKVA